jgi:adenylylsulfate kinase
MSKVILVFGLPGSGKTTFCKMLMEELKQFSVTHLNADKVREEYNDWDFSSDGRIRQAQRMRELADKQISEYTLCDFVCPFSHIRQSLFKSAYCVFLNTIKEGRFENTNKVFESPRPSEYNFIIEEFDSIQKSAHIISAILQYQLFSFEQQPCS